MLYIYSTINTDYLYTMAAFDPKNVKANTDSLFTFHINQPSKVLQKFSVLPWKPNLPKDNKNTRLIWVFIVLGIYNFGI